MDVIFFLLVWGGSLLTFLAGFWVGASFGCGKTLPLLGGVRDALRGIAVKNAAVGPVLRPSSEKVNLWTNTKLEEEDAAMSAELKKTLGNPEDFFQRV